MMTFRRACPRKTSRTAAILFTHMIIAQPQENVKYFSELIYYNIYAFSTHVFRRFFDSADARVAHRLVLNYGCDATREMAPLVDMPVSWFSAKTMPEQRRQDDVLYYLENSFIMRRAGETVKEVLDISKIKVPGIHNVENFMTAIALTWGFVSNRTIYDVARKFKGVEHRCELVRLVGGVKYYNSSIDSSPTRTEACLRSFKEKVIVICGGYDKHIPYEPLAKPLIDCAKVVVLVGATSSKIKEALLADPDYDGSPEIIEIEGLDDASFVRAVRTAGERAEPGDSVVLSPASASFDMFKNFMTRGNRFKEIVRSLEDE